MINKNAWNIANLRALPLTQKWQSKRQFSFPLSQENKMDDDASLKTDGLSSPLPLPLPLPLPSTQFLSIKKGRIKYCSIAACQCVLSNLVTLTTTQMNCKHCSLCQPDFWQESRQSPGQRVQTREATESTTGCLNTRVHSTSDWLPLVPSYPFRVVLSVVPPDDSNICK